MFQRACLVFTCSVLALSGCKSSSSNAGSVEAGLSFEQKPDIRRHNPALDSIRSLAHKVPGTPLKHGLKRAATPNVVGGTKEDPNTGPAGLSYLNGPMLESPQVYVVFWGSTVDATVQSTMPTFFSSAFGDNAFMTGVNEYNATTAYTIGTASYKGSFVDADAPMGTNSTITDLDIQVELTRLIDEGKLPQNNGHNIFMVYFPPGLTIDQGGGSLSCQVFCAYHGGFMRNGSPAYYGVMPDLTTGPCKNVCGPGTPISNEESTSSHELIEATTDANVFQGFAGMAWYDTVDGPDGIGGEIGDICVNWEGMSGGYTVQSMWSNESNSCRTAKSTGSAELTIQLNDQPTAAVDESGARTVDIPIQLTVPAPVPGSQTAANGPFTLTSNLDGAPGFTTSFTPPTLNGSGTATFHVTLAAGLRSQDLTFVVDAQDADGAHHWGQGQIAVLGAHPTVTSYTPNHGPSTGGTPVTATGMNWGVGSTVQLCENPPACTQLRSVAGGYVGGTGGTKVQFTTPGHPAGAVKFRLANLNDSQTIDLDYTYDTAPAPAITSATPMTGPVSGGNVVELVGANFGPEAFVSVDGAAITDPNLYLAVDSQHFLFVMPSVNTTTFNLNPPIIITNGDGTTNGMGTGGDGQASAAFTGYTYTQYSQSPPAVSSISPTMGPSNGGTYVQIVGSDFSSTVIVKFGGAQATVLSKNENFITVNSPAHAAGAVDVVVINSDNQTATAPSQFTYTASTAPAITSITPIYGPTAGGNSVVIDGANFDANADVTFDSTTALVTSGSSTSLTVTAPAHAAGSVTVTVKNADSQTATTSYLYSDTPPDMALSPSDLAVSPTDMAAPLDLSGTGGTGGTGGGGGTGGTGGTGGGGGSGNHGGCSATGSAPPSAALPLVGLMLIGLAFRRRTRSS